MTTILIIILFILLFISFYCIALLYTKVSKFDDLEKKQRKLMAEMDDSIAAYLTELKDENDRLLEELTNHNLSIEEAPVQQDSKQKIDNHVPPTAEPTFTVKNHVLPKNIALQSYKQVHSPPKNEVPGEAEVDQVSPNKELDERTRAIRLHEAGESIEEIAKTLGKGKTEVELILKFR